MRVDETQRVCVCFVSVLDNAMYDLLTSGMPEEAPEQDSKTYNPWHDAHVRKVKCFECNKPRAYAASSVLDLSIQRHNVYGQDSDSTAIS